MKEPLWKSILNWGVVIIFFIMPLLFFIIQIYSLTHPSWLQGKVSENHLQYLRDMIRNVAILTFGLAGLKTWEQIQTRKKNEH